MENTTGWIDFVPDGWNIMNFGQVIERISTGLNPRDNFKLTKTDKRYYVTIKNFKDGKLYLDDKCDRISENAWEVIQERSDLHKGDILLASISKEGQVYLLKEEPNNWNVNESVFCIRVNKRCMNNRYFCYEITNVRYYDDLLMDATGTTFKSIKQNNLKQSRLLVPPLSEQQAIADYLDETCSKIDEIIAEAKVSIDEYKNLREAVISNATTRGIKKNRSMKSSGVEWLPKIPADWNVLSPKVVFTQRKDRAIKGERQLTASQKHGIMYQDDYMKEEGVRIVTVEKDFNILKHVEPDDFVISMRSFQGGLEYSYLRGCISSAYVMLIPNHKYVYSEYYKWFFKSDKYINALQSTSDLIRDGQALRYANFVKLKLFDIPIEEQKEIADYLNKEVPKIDSLIAEKESLINDLEAYKKSLIYEVVTGKRRVV